MTYPGTSISPFISIQFLLQNTDMLLQYSILDVLLYVIVMCISSNYAIVKIVLAV